MRLRRLAAIIGVSCLPLGCLVQVEHVQDPSREFARARAEAVRLQGRPGPAHEVNVLAFDSDEGKLVRISVPMWLARRIEAEARHDEPVEARGRLADGDDAEQVLHRLRIRDVEKAGLGILVEVAEDQGDKVLVWLK
jgi:hypothetical protein